MEIPLQRVLDKASVHNFYVALLQEKLGFEFPIPNDIQAAVAGKIPPSEEQLDHWLALLDLAVSPVMIRDGLRNENQRESAEALLRYFCDKQSLLESDRDKADFTASFLFRAAGIRVRSLAEWATDRSSAFEREIYGILRNDIVVPLAEEYRQLLREFPFIRHEVDDLSRFDELIDSGIMHRVRDIKLRFSSAFYHPRVLANIAEYNVFVGDRFDELFREATRSIKQFAANVQQAGGSIMARVEDDVTVKHLVDVEEDVLLKKEYAGVQEQMRRISKFKKAVDRRRSGTQKPIVGAKTRSVTDAPRPKPVLVPSPSARGGSAAEIQGALDKAAEETKLSTMLESIRSFILAADEKSVGAYPMRSGNLALSHAEIDAFKAEYRDEKSFRGDYAYALSHCVALTARLVAELDEFRQRQSSAYLWKPHADSLTYLLEEANRSLEDCSAVLRIAENRGLAEKASAMNASLQRLRTHCVTVAKALEHAGSSK